MNFDSSKISIVVVVVVFMDGSSSNVSFQRLSSGYYQSRSFVSTWVSSGFSGFFTPVKNTHVGGLATRNWPSV